MPDHLGDDMRKVRPEEKEEEIKCLYIILLIKNKNVQQFENLIDFTVIVSQLWMKVILNYSKLM